MKVQLKCCMFEFVHIFIYVCARMCICVCDVYKYRRMR